MTRRARMDSNLPYAPVVAVPIVLDAIDDADCVAMVVSESPKE